MGHALHEIWRVLTPQAYLIDLRPLHVKPFLEIIYQGSIVRAGQIDETKGAPDDIAANQALAELVEQKWFIPEETAKFNFPSYWDNPDELKTYADAHWRNTHIPADVLTQARYLMPKNTAEAKVCVRSEMIIARYRKNSISLF